MPSATATLTTASAYCQIAGGTLSAKESNLDMPSPDESEILLSILIERKGETHFLHRLSFGLSSGKTPKEESISEYKIVGHRRVSRADRSNERNW